MSSTTQEQSLRKYFEGNKEWLASRACVIFCFCFFSPLVLSVDAVCWLLCSKRSIFVFCRRKTWPECPKDKVPNCCGSAAPILALRRLSSPTTNPVGHWTMDVWLSDRLSRFHFHHAKHCKHGDSQRHVAAVCGSVLCGGAQGQAHCRRRTHFVRRNRCCTRGKAVGTHRQLAEAHSGL
jgi:hypothetical protein